MTITVKTRTISEMLSEILNLVEAEPGHTLKYPGLCSYSIEVYDDRSKPHIQRIVEQHKMEKYLDENLPWLPYNGGRHSYCWTVYLKKPRVEWLKQEIKKLKEQNHEVIQREKA